MEPGEVVGFLGPNGAGKTTTTMRILTGFLPASDGTASIAGHDIFTDPIEARRAVGYLPESPPLYPEMTVQSYLLYVTKLKDVPRAARSAAVDRALERCGLGDVRRRVIGTLSKGFRQRVGLAQAIVHDPQVLILDEPTVGLDPIQIREIRNLISTLASERPGESARTVILSTHILPGGRRPLSPRDDHSTGAARSSTARSPSCAAGVRSKRSSPGRPPATPATLAAPEGEEAQPSESEVAS